MPPKARTFRVKREEVHPVAAGDDRYDGGTPAPILSVAVGTAGYKRSWNWAKRMGQAGVLNRIQGMFIYDCNQATVADIESSVDQMRRVPRGGDLPVILPEFFPKVDGFLRDPNAYKDFYGLIDRDLDRMVDLAAQRSEVISSPPQIIIEWLGFGGHAKLGGLLHQKLVDQFPDALFLPIVLLPREHALEENMRRETWGAYEGTMSRLNPKTGVLENSHPALLTDNGMSRNYATLDDKLAIGLASAESAMAHQTDSGSLAETVASFGQYSNGWLGMRVLSRRVDVAEVSQPRGRFRIPFVGNREMAVIKGRDNQITWQIKTALWEMVDGKRRDLQLADHDPIEDESVIRMVVTLPANSDGIKDIASDVQDQLDREGFQEAFPNLTYSFAPARFPINNSDHHMFVSMVYPLRNTGIPSIERIMGKADGLPRFGENGDDLLKIGFGTGHFLPQNGDFNTQVAEQYSYRSRGHERRAQRDEERQRSRGVADQQYGNGYSNGDNSSGEYRR